MRHSGMCVQCYDSLTALHCAILNNHPGLAAFLIQWGANTVMVDARYRSPIHYAAEMGSGHVRTW